MATAYDIVSGHLVGITGSTPAIRKYSESDTKNTTNEDHQSFVISHEARKTHYSQ